MGSEKEKKRRRWSRVKRMWRGSERRKRGEDISRQVKEISEDEIRNEAAPDRKSVV